LSFLKQPGPLKKTSNCSVEANRVAPRDVYIFEEEKDKMVASFRDPARTFKPIEVLERLLEIAEFYGGSPVLYISSDEDLISYLDSFGFDIYSLTTNTSQPFDSTSQTTMVLPSGTRSHDSATAH